MKGQWPWSGFPISRSFPRYDESKIISLCDQIVAKDKAILFSAISHKVGYLIGHSSSAEVYVNREVNNNQPVLNDPSILPVTPESSLNDAEMEKYTFHTGILCGLHKSWEHKFGRIKKFVAYYDEITLVTIMLDEDHFLLIGFDVSKNDALESIVSEKIVPYLARNAITFL